MTAGSEDAGVPSASTHMPRDHAIDGWRGVAASFVVLAHASVYRFSDVHGGAAYVIKRVADPLAEIGVQIFFVISGYIITSLLLREETSRKSVSIGAFYARRVCRIMPPLLVYYAALFLLRAAGVIYIPDHSLISSATFTCNTGMVQCEWWVAHTWSLAVEEQFYLVWPVLFAFARSDQRVRLLIIVVAGCSIGVLVQGPVAHGNFTSFTCIAIGALYAGSIRFRHIVTKWKSTPFWLAVAILLIVGPLLHLGAVFTVLLPVLITYLIFAGNLLPLPKAVLTSRPLQILGAGSYSLYLWQQAFLAPADKYTFGSFNLLLLPIVVLLSVWLIEKPMIRIGRAWSRRISPPTRSDGSTAS